MMYTPTHTIPNKSHLGEGFRAFSTRGNCHPLFHQNSKIVSGTTYLPSTVDGRILLVGVSFHRTWLVFLRNTCEGGFLFKGGKESSTEVGI